MTTTKPTEESESKIKLAARLPLLINLALSLTPPLIFRNLYRPLPTKHKEPGGRHSPIAEYKIATPGSGGVCTVCKLGPFCLLRFICPDLSEVCTALELIPKGYALPRFIKDAEAIDSNDDALAGCERLRMQGASVFVCSAILLF